MHILCLRHQAGTGHHTWSKSSTLVFNYWTHLPVIPHLNEPVFPGLSFQIVFWISTWLISAVTTGFPGDLRGLSVGSEIINYHRVLLKHLNIFSIVKKFKWNIGWRWLATSWRGQKTLFRSSFFSDLHTQKLTYMFWCIFNTVQAVVVSTKVPIS